MGRQAINYEMNRSVSKNENRHNVFKEKNFFLKKKKINYICYIPNERKKENNTNNKVTTLPNDSR